MDIGCANRAVAVDELERDLSKFVLLDDLEDTSYGDDKDGENVEPCGPKHGNKCSGESPCDGKGKGKGKGKGSLTAPDNDVEHNDGDDERKTALHVERDNATAQLVSAIKGSREKLGAVPRKLTVKWAPDVYDPVPTLISHTVKGKQKSKKDKGKDYNNCSKKNKRGQKGNRGGSSKDKKQVRKHGGRSEKGHRTMDAVDRVAHPTGNLDDYGVGGPDYCWRSSFLQESLTKFHYYVTEA